MSQATACWQACSIAQVGTVPLVVEDPQFDGRLYTLLAWNSWTIQPGCYAAHFIFEHHFVHGDFRRRVAQECWLAAA